ncbi:MAG: cyclic nucleotide-binding domain-containing protein [Betaproteobacteria bacterium]|nr:cyclic nucleotide-binding domain-containing protein [Betaproteobacteria bacterium]
MSGAPVVRHGDPARGAFLLREGLAEVSVPAPGGNAIVLARLGPGDLFGEMALVDQGTCIANVTASAALDGWFVEREAFRGAVSRRGPAARDLQHALTMHLAERLRAMNARLAAVDREDAPTHPPAPESPFEPVRSRKGSFDAARFLAKLPFFDRFPPDEIDEVFAAGRMLELPRGAPLYRAGDPATAVYLVVRGAVEIARPSPAGDRRLAILGPGQPVGFVGALAGGMHGAHATVREAAAFLEIATDDFRTLYFGDEGVSVRVRAATQRHLLESLARTNRALARLATHARLAGAPLAGPALWVETDQSR